MKKLLVVFLLSFCVASAQDITQLGTFTSNIKVVIVSIEQAWNSTGITVNAGDSITIIMNGIAATNGKTKVNTFLWVGPEGIGTPGGAECPIPDQSAYSIIGKIGESGTPFYVGRNCSFTSNISGELFLGNNDYIFWDNYGYFVAFITCSNRNIFNNVIDNSINEPKNISLSQNYPNPFNPSTTINYSVPGTSNVQIKIYDLNGRLIKTLIDATTNAGNYSISWDGKDYSGISVSSGAYFYQVQVGSFSQAKKMLLIK